jgi:hypothetical protein
MGGAIFVFVVVAIFLVIMAVCSRDEKENQDPMKYNFMNKKNF